MKLKLTISILLAAVLCGCMTATTQRLRTDPQLQSMAEQLTLDYLDGQKEGESERVVAQKYGGGGTFYNLVEYRIEGLGHEFGQPAVFFRVKAGNRVGGVFWKDYRVTFRHDPKLEATGDHYMGLRISSCAETLQQSLRD